MSVAVFIVIAFFYLGGFGVIRYLLGREMRRLKPETSKFELWAGMQWLVRSRRASLLRWCAVGWFFFCCGSVVGFAYLQSRLQQTRAESMERRR